jgi:tRNA nucleotidyltransferase (CCA-adding enzyme)
VREPPAKKGPSESADDGQWLQAVPDQVRELMDVLWSAGHSAYVVGGSLRDALLDRDPADWDLATDARPERIQALFPAALYENRFGTVTVRHHGLPYEVTTFRTDNDYTDFRRPDSVQFGESIEADLARRDFTVNALAWGGEAARDGTQPAPELVDPHGGLGDLRARTLRAVGDPERRFREDALRMIRAVRLAATLEFEIEPATFGAIHRSSGLAAHLSGERVAAELDKLLRARKPSTGLRLMAASGLLAVVFPELATQRGVAQNKIAGEDLWDHTLRTVDAAPADGAVVRLAALLHDVGKPPTAADGHFYQHEVVGAEVAEEILKRLHRPREPAARVVHLVRQHMFRYEPEWTDTAVRRFIGKVGPGALEDLLALREADNIGSGLERDAGDLPVLRRRIAHEMQAGVALDRSALAVHGDELMRELELRPGPSLGRLIDRLVERVIADPGLNRRETLIEIARSEIAGASPGGEAEAEGADGSSGDRSPDGRR